MPFTPDSLLPTAEEEVRRALWCSPEAAGADPCMGLSEKASASDPGEVPTAVTALLPYLFGPPPRELAAQRSNCLWQEEDQPSTQPV